MSVVGAKRTFWNVGCLVAIGGKADISQRLPNNHDPRQPTTSASARGWVKGLVQSIAQTSCQ